MQSSRLFQELRALSEQPAGAVPEDVDERSLCLEASGKCYVFETVDTETRELIADGFDLMLER